ncbi:hypothetical protein GCM10009596_11280 [Arthrobacter rhombi]
MYRLRGRSVYSSRVAGRGRGSGGGLRWSHWCHHEGNPKCQGKTASASVRVCPRRRVARIVDIDGWAEWFAWHHHVWIFPFNPIARATTGDVSLFDRQKEDRGTN